jgi:nucleotide-binding universal stress UspA family protein
VSPASSKFTSGTILVCYDGSDDARAAVESAAKLFPGASVTVLTVWQPFADVVARTTVGFGMVPSIPDSAEVDDASGKSAEKTAAEGVELAQKLGLEAEPQTFAQTSTTARAILAEADKLGASAILMGSRGLTGVKSLLLGSVSHEVIQHADRTVVVVPSPHVAASRAREIHEEAPD